MTSKIQEVIILVSFGWLPFNDWSMIHYFKRPKTVIFLTFSPQQEEQQQTLTRASAAGKRGEFRGKVAFYRGKTHKPKLKQKKQRKKVGFSWFGFGWGLASSGTAHKHTQFQSIVSKERKKSHKCLQWLFQTPESKENVFAIFPPSSMVQWMSLKL